MRSLAITLSSALDGDVQFLASVENEREIHRLIVALGRLPACAVLWTLDTDMEDICELWDKRSA